MATKPRVTRSTKIPGKRTSRKAPRVLKQAKPIVATGMSQEPAATGDPELVEMMKAGLHFGHKTSRWNPKMAPFIFTTRNGVHVIDLAQTRERLEAALGFIESVVKRQGIIVFVGTRPHSRLLVQQLARELNMPYVVERWIGGTLTNFSTIRRRIDYFLNLKERRAKGELDKYTKKERLLFDREIAKLEKNWGGLVGMTRLPDAMIVFDLVSNATALRETRRTGIPVVALCDTNSDPTVITWPIPGNDDALGAVRFILGKIKERVLKAKSQVTHIQTNVQANVESQNKG